MGENAKWSDAELEQLRVFRVVQHLSATEIGKRLGRTRNSIIGKMLRTGIGLPEGVVAKHSPRKEREKHDKPQVVRMPKQNKRSGDTLIAKPVYAMTTKQAPVKQPLPMPVPVKQPLPMPVPVQPPDPSTRVTLIGLRSARCKYITGRNADGERLYCGGKTSGPTDSWCEFHKFGADGKCGVFNPNAYRYRT